MTDDEQFHAAAGEIQPEPGSQPARQPIPVRLFSPRVPDRGERRGPPLSPAHRVKPAGLEIQPGGCQVEAAPTARRSDCVRLAARFHRTSSAGSRVGSRTHVPIVASEIFTDQEY